MVAPRQRVLMRWCQGAGQPERPTLWLEGLGLKTVISTQPSWRGEGWRWSSFAQPVILSIMPCNETPIKLCAQKIEQASWLVFLNIVIARREAVLPGLRGKRMTGSFISGTLSELCVSLSGWFWLVSFRYCKMVIVSTAVSRVLWITVMN